GVYYWTITVDGETTWLTDDKGNKLPVSGTDGENGTNGKNGVTPLLKVDGDGYWMVSYDNGSSYTYVLDSYGHKVYAVGPQGPAGSDGEDGKKGDDGEDGEDGDSMFSNVVEKDGKVIIILADGTVIEIPIAAKVSLYFDSAKKTQLENTNEIPLETPDGSTTLYYTLSNGTIELLPSGNVDAAINETDQSITFTAKAADLSNSKVIALIMNNGQTSTCIFKFKAISTEEGQNLTITTRDELAWFAAQVNEGKTFNGETVTLGNDIDLNNEAWTPIGLNADESKKFKGVFDGQGHTISNLKVNTEAGYTAAGFFGALNGTAKNFTIDGASINHISTAGSKGSDNGIAVVAGSIYTSGSIEGVTVKNATVTGNRYLGGISGYTYGSVTNCTVENITLTATPDNQSGSYDNGDKVGGIAGYFASENIYQVTNNNVSNVTIKGYRDLGGIVGCADGANFVTNNTVAGTNSITVDQKTNYYEDKAANAASVVGRITAGTLDNSNTVSGTVAITINKKEVSLADLSTAVASGGDVTLTGDVKDKAASSSGYGSAGLVVNGGTLDGGNKVLTVENANGTWDCAVNPQAGTIKNVTINGAFRGIFMSGATGDVYIDNVVLDKVCYTFNSDAGNKNYSVIVTNSTLNGWTSYSDVHKEVKFTNCNFGKGTGGYQYASCRPYNKSQFENCVFEEGFEFDATRNNEIFFKNCKVGTTVITAENVVSLLGADAANIKFN
ncbi:MAG: hypothetical protein J6B46_04160, partial [Parabacteroides sp.]|nr:hypothetical protein [Parabacteroides sp.]